MFKKFKDKLAEEMKQSPARLTASMQQLAQAVVSPGLSSASIPELTSSNDNFSLTEDGDDTPKNSPARHNFQSVDLTPPSLNSMGLSRASSENSVTSVDPSGLFPIYESPSNMYHLQSDMDQSASEADEGIPQHIDQVSKEQIYSAYRKVQAKYNKYRGRYTDLANHYREMERIKFKLESLLVETQDKALRRIADLKEQCQLEQQAKAHLEDALRNDIEEKGHVIDTLNTKVRLLQANGSSLINFEDHEEPINKKEESKNHSSELVAIPSEETPPDEDATHALLTTENLQLKNKLKKLETLLSKYKDSLKNSKEKISELSEEKCILERDIDAVKNSANALDDELSERREEIHRLREDINIMKKREEECVISLAENKLSIHRELEIKEEQIKQLTAELKNAVEGKENSQEDADDDSSGGEEAKMVEELMQKLSNARDEANNYERTIEELKQELAQVKVQLETKNNNKETLEHEQTIQTLNAKIQMYVTTLQKAKEKIENQNIKIDKLIEEKENNEQSEKLQAELESKNLEILGLESELKSSRGAVNDLKEIMNEKLGSLEQLEEEKQDLLQKSINYMATIRSLKSNCDDLKSQMKDWDAQQKHELNNVQESLINRLKNYNLQTDTISELQMTIDDLNKQVTQHHSVEKELKDRKEEMVVISRRLEEENTLFKSKCEELTSEIVKQRDSVDEANSNASKDREEINVLHETIKNLNEQISLDNSTLEELRDKHNGVLNNLKIIEEENNLLQEKYQKADLKIKKLQDHLETAEKDAELLKIKLDEQENKLVICETQILAENAQKLKNLEEEIAKLNIEIEENNASFNEKLSSVLSEHQETKNNLEQSKTKLEELVQNYKTVTEENIKLKLALDGTHTTLKQEKSRWNSQLQDFMDIVQAKNEYIDTLKLWKKNQTSIIEDLTIKFEALKNENEKSSNSTEESVQNYIDRVDLLEYEKEALIKEVSSNLEEFNELQDEIKSLVSQNGELTTELEKYQEKSAQLENKIQELNESVLKLEEKKKIDDIELRELEVVKNELLKSNEESRDSSQKYVQELEQLVESNSNAIKNLTQEHQTRTRELEEKDTWAQEIINELKKEIEVLQARSKDSSQDDNNRSEDENALQIIINQLKAQLQDKDAHFIACQAKQTQVENINEELKIESNKLREQLMTSESEQAVRMKEMVKEFQAQLHDKDEELQAALDKKFDRQKNYESDLVQQYKEQLKDFQVELTAKSEQIESLKQGKSMPSNEEVNKLLDTIQNLKIEHENELTDIEMKWEKILQKQNDELETKHEVVVNELTREWKKNQAKDEMSVENTEELENMSRVAMAAVQSNTGSFHSLQQTLASQRRELTELRKLVKLRHETLEDSTEIEYLRNILYEYMMGKETMVLARVIAAVVKFDQEQTHKILKKEEDKLTLLGSLGLT